jgi:hypothetical protein
MAAMSLANAPQLRGWVRSALLQLRETADRFVAYRLQVVLAVAECSGSRTCQPQIAHLQPRSKP